MTLCKLCLANTADKKNYHIISKFLGSGLFEGMEPRHAILLNKNGQERKIQDTPKEDNIFCETCEKRFEVLETYFARIIGEMYHYKELPEKFGLILDKQPYIECKDFHPLMFKLFIYSLIWRVSISNKFEFQTFKLAKEDEEVIRVILHSILRTSKKSLIETVNAKPSISSYHFCMAMPEEKSPSSRGIYSACSLSPTSHVLLLVDFAIFFYTDNISIGSVLEKYSNKQNEKVIITLADETRWIGLNQIFINKMLGKKSKG